MYFEDFSVGQVLTTGRALLRAGGSLLDNGATGPNVTAAAVRLEAGTGAGTTATPLKLSTPLLAATAGSAQLLDRSF